jgi:hypothetical protein
MATRCTKPVRREVNSRRYGALIVSITPEGVTYREKGRRKSYTLEHGAAYQRAVLIEVNAQLAAKKAERAARRKARR